ncbi:tRNA pseudouridine(38-40) synthase TruA [Pelolinea submarina]|uniref:tRNA pseudouridine synthase A n=1 Tax=Pelolinea submarina TaxID=913107 RepID=A0A347ZVA3_9CHLR|nr:tRNA pseudouridine(38-40) synthase TruA [Pelolinea submarina]REG10180.1 tRNA pseudouridine38-40 synthase [Pelolinea submarina]BBB49234.1 tRNA pseudouridine38-40 synthase [Pelolinea submarina]
MALYQITIAYDGTDFCGFQRQAAARTVQNEIETALRRLGWNERSILSAGRTDSGVHASGQVVSFNLDWGHSQQKLLDALNDLLPNDIGVKDLSLAPEGFHPRYDARARRYRYQIYFNQVSDPLIERYYWRVWPELDGKVLKKGAELFLGKHDFRAFGRPPNEKSTSLRTINALNWEFSEDGSQAAMTIVAQAFLYHMVRRIVFVLVRAGQGRISLSDVEGSIERQLDLPAGIAPAKGLILEEIIYQ